MSDSFALAEVYWRLGWLAASRARADVLDAIDAGNDVPALYEFLAGGYGTTAEVHDAFARVLAELDCAPLEPGEAALRFAQLAAEEIASGSFAQVASMRVNWLELSGSPDLPEQVRPLVTLALRHTIYQHAPDLLPDFPAVIVEAAHRLQVATLIDG